VKPARLVDLTTAGTRYDVMKAALDILTAAPEFNLILSVVGSSARFHPELAVRPIVDSAGAAIPIAAYLVPEASEALAALSAAGIPNFRTPEACADAIAAALKRRVPTHPSSWPGLTRPSTSSKPTVHQDVDARHKAGHDELNHRGRPLDEQEAYDLVARLGIPCAPSVVLDAEVTSVPSLPFPFPVAVKALSAEIAHKTEIGGVVLGVADAVDLLAAIRNIRETVGERRPKTKIDRFLVQPMISGIGEVLVGYRVDPDVGPLVMVAAGGVFTEIYRDRSLRLAPVDLETAREMIAEVRGLAPLAGYRGKPKGDLDALARAIVALSGLTAQPNVIEAEINPLMVRPAGQGVVAVDALVKLMV
jgi:acetate---CoA ligase (ADP-forming)